MACLRRDYRWWWVFDERSLYLARLVRDLALPVSAVVDAFRTATEEDNARANISDVLAVLGRGGDAVAIDGLRRYVHDGPGWSRLCRRWPGSGPASGGLTSFRPYGRGWPNPAGRTASGGPASRG
jgi:hypothetical protein